MKLIGDKIEEAVKPIAKALKLKCLDDGGELRPESKCAKRKDWFNRIHGQVIAKFQESKKINTEQ